MTFIDKRIKRHIIIVMDNKKSAASYKNIFLIVRDVINSVDPESLEPGLPDGSPVDEYELEVTPITLFLVQNQNDLDSNLLTQEIDKVWVKFFERSCANKEKIAAEILKRVSVL